MLSLIDRPAPDANRVGHVYNVLGEETTYICVDARHTASAAEGTFDAATARTDFHVVSHLPGGNLNDLTEGDFYYPVDDNPATGGREFYEVVTRNGVHEYEYVEPSVALAASRSSNSQRVVFLGAESSATEALEFTFSVLAADDYFHIDTVTNTLRILDQTTFVAAGATAHHYKWVATGDRRLIATTALPGSPSLNDVIVYVGSEFRGAVPAWDAGIALPTGEGNPKGVEVKANGDLVIVGSQTLKVYTYLGGSWDAGIALPTGEDAPQGVSSKANGDLVIVGSDTDKVYTYSGGSWDAGIAVPTGEGNPQGVSSKANGDLVIVGSDTDKVYTLSGGSWDAGIALPTGEGNPQGVEVKANGDLVIVGSDTDRVYTYSGGSWDAGIAVPTGEPFPKGVSSKANGDLVIVGSTTDRVYTAVYTNPTHPERIGVAYWDGGRWVALG